MALFGHVDEGGLLEYSVVFNDRFLELHVKNLPGGDAGSVCRAEISL